MIGGGPAGAATAIALGRAGARVILLERSRDVSVRRAETLPPRARVLLTRLGAWEAFLRQGHAPSPGTMAAWGDNALYEKPSICNPYGDGWCVDRRRLDEGLRAAAQEAGARVMRGARATTAQREAGHGWRIGWAGSQAEGIVRAGLFIDATGRTCALARAQGVTRVTYDSLVGIVSSFAEHGREPVADRRTLVEAVENGWWYSARLPEGGIVAAYMTDADFVREAKGHLAAYFCRRLEDAPRTRARLDSRSARIELAVMPANSSRLRQVAGSRWLAVGDAAMAQDPLSSQGICRALESGLDAAAVICAEPSAQNTATARYERRMRLAFAGYLRQRTAHYRGETRWSQSAFWSRRTTASSGTHTAGPIGSEAGSARTGNVVAFEDTGLKM